MKKSLLLLLFVVITTIGIQAATKYEINVGGVEVTSDNKNNVTGGDIKSGTVKYDPDNKTLTLTNVTITRTGGSNYGVHNRNCAGLKMKFVGTCNVSSNTANAIHLDKNTVVEVTSGSTLNASITAGENYGRGVIYVNDNVAADMHGDGTLNISGQMKEGGSRGDCATCGFEGKGKSSNSNLNFANINVVMDVTQHGIYKFGLVRFYSGDVKVNYDYGFYAMCDVQEMIFNTSSGMACVTPADATFNSNGGYFGSSNASYAHFTDNYGVIISTANFPDENFRTAMRWMINVVDGHREQYLTKAQLQNLTSLDVSGKSISNLTGVNLLTYLTDLNCSNNNLASLPTLPNSLKTLKCESNLLTSLPTIPNSLQKLYCGYNKFSSLTITGKTNLNTLSVSYNTNLTSLNCSNNALTNLYVYGCSAMTTLRFNNNQISQISSLPKSLQELYCGNNKFTTLTVKNFTRLTTLNAANSTLLTKLNCASNALTYLNVDGCTVMTDLDCSDNQFTSLSSLPSGLKALDCHNNKLTTLPTLPSGFESMDCSNNLFTALTITGNTSLSFLNMANNTRLTSLNCSGNVLSYLNVSGCSAMTTLNCTGNKLRALKVSGLSSLSDLQCYRNELYLIEFQGNTALKTVNAFSNDFAMLNVSECPSLNWLNIRANRITGDNMTSLINSMRSIPTSEALGTFYVYGENYSGDMPEGNAINNAQIKSVRDKRWIPSHKVGSDWVEITASGVRGDLNGDGIVDVTDVNIIIDMVLGKQAADFTTADLDNNGMVDVSDVNALIDIVLGKG